MKTHWMWLSAVVLSVSAAQAADEVSEVRQSCEGVSFAIRASAEGGTQLGILDADGTLKPIAAPAEMQDHPATGLGCSTSAQDGKPYFVVHYGGDCSICEWFYLYDAQGVSLSDREDIFLQHEGRNVPNNESYEKQLKALGLEHAEVTYLE